MRRAGTIAGIGKDDLIDLQNAIGEPRFADQDYRRSQNYVGSMVDWQRDLIHYVSPRPEDVPDLMAGRLTCLDRSCADDAGIDPVLAAAAVSFGFVLIHPFEDGNGRIHRYLIHHILARSGFTPVGTVLPVSAAILADLPA